MLSIQASLRLQLSRCYQSHLLLLQSLKVFLSESTISIFTKSPYLPTTFPHFLPAHSLPAPAQYLEHEPQRKTSLYYAWNHPSLVETAGPGAPFSRMEGIPGSSPVPPKTTSNWLSTPTPQWQNVLGSRWHSQLQVPSATSVGEGPFQTDWKGEKASCSLAA